MRVPAGLRNEATVRLLDLFSGAGGATRGYQLAGFEVWGVDIAPQPRYVGERFHQGDALEYLERYGADNFDAIHASPPCQAYTNMNNRHASASPPLIDKVRELLIATGLPYVIENVVGARSEMRDPVLIHGGSVGLASLARPRLFETNWPLMVPKAAMPKDAVPVYGRKLDGRRLFTRKDGTELRAPRSLEVPAKAMGIDWMTWDELREAIPPAYTELVGVQLAAYLSANKETESSDVSERP